MRTGLSPHPTNVSDTARDRTVIPDGAAGKAGPGTAAAHCLQSFRPEPHAGRAHGSSWDEEAGAARIPREKQGEEKVPGNGLWRPQAAHHHQCPIVPTVL